MLSSVVFRVEMRQLPFFLFTLSLMEKTDIASHSRNEDILRQNTSFAMLVV